MKDQQSASEEKARTSGADKWVKRSFLAVIIVLGVAVYLYQTRDTSIAGWTEDLDGALEQARNEKRRIVIFFTGSPPSETARRVKIRILRPGNIKALNKGNYLSVVSTVDSSDSKLAKKYGLKVEKLPVLVILDHEGKEIARNEGDIGEQAFREFLQAD